MFHTERELGGGYADICLEPFLVRFTAMRHGYVIELKYLKRSASANRGTRRGRSAGDAGPVAALPGRRTLGAAVPIGAVHRPGARVPRLGTGAQRHDNPAADLKSHAARIPALPYRALNSRPRAATPPLDASFIRRSYASMVRDSRYKLVTWHAPNRQLLIAASPCNPCTPRHHWHTMP